MTDGKQVKNLSNPTGTGKYLNESGQYVALSSSSGFKYIEIDFGTIPVSSASFTITDVSVLSTNDILVFTETDPATGRLGNDWDFDMPFFSTIASNGSFTLSVVFNHFVVGKRNVKYQIV